MKGNCEICDKEITIHMCCSGHECGCMGQPIEPPVCSDECYKKWKRGKDQILSILNRKMRKKKINQILNHIKNS